MKKTDRWLRSLVWGFVAMIVVLIAIAGAGNQTTPPRGSVSLSPTWQEALRQYLQTRQPGLENQLRQSWQKRALVSRQPRVQELPLTEAPGNERNPAWSPDRRVIAFSSNSVDTNGNRRLDRNDGIGSRYRIWIMEPDGSNARPAIPENEIPPTVPIGDELYPAWFPDAGILAYVISAGEINDIVQGRKGLLEYVLKHRVRHVVGYVSDVACRGYSDIDGDWTERIAYDPAPTI